MRQGAARCSSAAGGTSCSRNAVASGKLRRAASSSVAYCAACTSAGVASAAPLNHRSVPIVASEGEAQTEVEAVAVGIQLEVVDIGRQHHGRVEMEIQ